MARQGEGKAAWKRQTERAHSYSIANGSLCGVNDETRQAKRALSSVRPTNANPSFSLRVARERSGSTDVSHAPKRSEERVRISVSADFGESRRISEDFGESRQISESGSRAPARVAARAAHLPRQHLGGGTAHVHGVGSRVHPRGAWPRGSKPKVGGGHALHGLAKGGEEAAAIGVPRLPQGTRRCSRDAVVCRCGRWVIAPLALSPNARQS